MQDQPNRLTIPVAGGVSAPELQAEIERLRRALAEVHAADEALATRAAETIERLRRQLADAHREIRFGEATLRLWAQRVQRAEADLERALPLPGRPIRSGSGSTSGSTTPRSGGRRRTS